MLVAAWQREIIYLPSCGSDPKWTFARRQFSSFIPSFIFAFLSWRSAISCEHSWLREKLNRFNSFSSFFFFPTVARVQITIVCEFQRLHREDCLRSLGCSVILLIRFGRGGCWSTISTIAICSHCDSTMATFKRRELPTLHTAWEFDI